MTEKFLKNQYIIYFDYGDGNQIHLIKINKNKDFMIFLITIYVIFFEFSNDDFCYIF